MGEEGFSGDGDDSKSLWTGMIFFLVGSSVASLYDGRLDWEPLTFAGGAFPSSLGCSTAENNISQFYINVGGHAG